jgi:hypothetical protein
MTVVGVRQCESCRGGAASGILSNFRKERKSFDRILDRIIQNAEGKNYEGVHGSNTSKAQKGGSIVLTTGILGSDQSFRRFRAVACTSGL